MGPHQSKTTTTSQSKTQPQSTDLVRIPVPRATSVGYGRVLLDSPRSRSIRRSLRKHRSADSLPGELPSGAAQQRRPPQRRASVVSAPTTPINSKPITETSPLLMGRGMLSNDVSSLLPAIPDNTLSSDFYKGSTSSLIPPACWLVPALICATCYALYNICIKLGSASIHPILGGVILQFVAAILGTVMLLLIMWKDGGMDDLHYDAEGIKWAVWAGVAVGAAEILSFTVSGLGVPASQSIPIIIGGSVGIGCVLGLVILHETLGVQGWIGVALIIFGVGLVGTDPSGAGAML